MTEKMATRRPRSAAALRERLLAGAPVRERKIEAAGIPTAVAEGGTGEPLLLLHGPGEHLLKWVEVLPELTRTHRVIAPDLPGHGATPVPPGAPTMERVLAWLGGVIDATCPTPPTIVGHVLGGAIALRYAARHGDRVRGLVLVDTLGLAPFQPAPEFGAALGAYLAAPDETTLDGLMRYCTYDFDRLRARAGEVWSMLAAYQLELLREPGRLETLDELMAQFGFSPVSDEALAKIRVPVRLVWGRHDLATSVTVAEAASARYGWPLRVIEDCADDPALEQPERFVDAVRG